MTIASQQVEPNVGSLSLTTNPPGARIYIDCIDTGQNTPVIITDIPVGIHAYELELEGYSTYRGLIEIIQDLTAEILEIILNPIPSLFTGSLSLTTNPPGARIYIDCLDTNLITPVIITDIPVGIHAYELELEGYSTYRGLIEIIQDLTAEIPEITLGSMLGPYAIGSLSLTTNPPGAKIYIDCLDTNTTTPSVITDIPVGIHTYELELEGYSTYRGLIEIIQDIMVDVSEITLSSILPPYAIGSLSITTNPPGARIYIDCLDTNLTTPVIITDMPVGIHTYTLKLTDYNDYTGNISIPNNGLVYVQANLIPRDNCVLFESSPSGAELTIQGSGRKFTTPVMVCDLPLGKLEYHLKLHEYKTFNGCTTLVAGHGENINHNMITKTNKKEEEEEEE